MNSDTQQQQLPPSLRLSCQLPSSGVAGWTLPCWHHESLQPPSLNQTAGGLLRSPSSGACSLPWNRMACFSTACSTLHQFLFSSLHVEFTRLADSTVNRYCPCSSSALFGCHGPHRLPCTWPPEDNNASRKPMPPSPFPCMLFAFFHSYSGPTLGLASIFQGSAPS